MPVGSLDRYSGLQGGGYVELGKDKQVKQLGDTPFFGRIVKWHIDNRTRNDDQQRQLNRDVRQDFFIALRNANKDIARQYPQELVGGDNETKPLSARRVREIMTEVAKKKFEDQPLRKPSIETRMAPIMSSIVELVTKFHERRNDLGPLLHKAIANLAEEMGASKPPGRTSSGG